MLKSIKKSIALILISFAFIFVCSSSFAFTCDQQLTPMMIAHAFAAGTSEQNKFLNQLKPCLAHDKNLQKQADNVIDEFLQNIQQLPPSDQQPFVNYILQILKANAESGYAPSQQGYAVVHNARPGSLIQKIVPQNYDTFIYWTRKAAAQAYPNALFNLAMRMSSKNKVTGVKYDPQTAYILLSYLQNTFVSVNEVTNVIKQAKDQLAKQLGKMETQLLDKESQHYDFSKLAPTEKH